MSLYIFCDNISCQHVKWWMEDLKKKQKRTPHMFPLEFGQNFQFNN